MLKKEGKEDAKECRGKDTALLHTALDVGRFGHAALVLNGGLHVIMERSNHTVQILGHPIFRRMLKSPSRVTRSNALVRSTKAM